ncbi:MAG: superoxide dismutase [Bdellovibrionales bacterium]
MKLLVAFFMFISVSQASLKSLNSEKFPLKLPDLLYPSDSLIEAVDKDTMEIHHGRHHKAYVDNANKALPDEKRSILEVIKTISQSPEVVRNNVGGHWNHAFFWQVLTPNKKHNEMPSRLKKEIEKAFGSVEQFKQEVEKAGLGRFGSVWVWLIRNQEGKLQISSTPNQDNPLMDIVNPRGVPVFGLDVWEHAYYLKYQNKRADYLKNMWGIINWKQVDEFDREASKLKL